MYRKITIGHEWSLGVFHFLLFLNLKRFYEIYYAISELFAFSSSNMI
jgi:hypothetical protein